MRNWVEREEILHSRFSVPYMTEAGVWPPSLVLCVPAFGDAAPSKAGSIAFVP